MENNIKNLALLKNNSNKITGSGVMLIHHYNGEPSIIIVHNKHSDKWDIPGGRVDSSDISPQYTAAKELKEETGCLFNIDMNILDKAEYCDISKADMTYRCYILFIEADIHRKYYYDNMKILNKYNVPHCYKETDKLNRLKLNDFKLDNKIIRDRDATIIKKSIDIIDKVLKTVPIKLKYSDNKKISEFPNITNLKSYYI